MDKLVSVILPAKNEAETLGMVLDSLKSNNDFVGEILVVDGNSEDNTRQIALDFGATVVLDNGIGKGDAIRVGIKESKGDILVFMDADGSHNSNDIYKLVTPVLDDELDMVIASRWKGGSDEFVGTFSQFVRSFGGTLITTVMNYRWRVMLSDSLNGFRAIKKEVAKDLNLTAQYFDIEQQMVAQCLKKGYRVGDVPSHEFARAGGKTKLPTFKKPYIFFWRLFVDCLF
jgi:dolichol-phosphate mannosyltransferase